MKTIMFEDKGQDFLEWDIDKEGVVTESRPFQNSIWKETRVILETLKVGMRPKVILKLRLGVRDIRVLNYNVVEIKELEK